MKFSYNWLKELIGLTQSPAEIETILTQIGHEVEGVVTIGNTVKDIITVRINSIKKHPDANKLVITQVTDGTNQIQIVTGATNIQEGDIVPMSPPGSTLANGSVIKASKLRGIDSFGMLCSETEVGVSDSADGIWILPKDTPVGADFSSYAGLKDTIFDIAILPNRGDCQSHIGLARDLAAYLNLPITLPKTLTNASLPESNIQLTHQSSTTPHYTARSITNITSSPTPLWMQQRLRSCDVRPINLLVDITNYILLETGQPLHAFDANKIKDHAITIRPANHNESITLLDQQTINLTEEDIVIANHNTPIALGGIMGGHNTEVTETTTDVILESAHFDAITIRRSALRLNVRTDSAIRFEKGIDSNGITAASDRAAYLYATLGNATIHTIVDHHTTTPTNKTLAYAPEQINTLLGTSYTHQEINQTLSSLGFTLSPKTITIPSWRHKDIQEIPCLAEEVARIRGFDSIPTALPHTGIIQEKAPPQHIISQKIRTLLTHIGHHEINTFPMISPNDLPHFGYDQDTCISIQNPLSQDESVMRPLLLPSLLKVTAYNTHRQIPHLKLFEIGKVFGQAPQEESYQLGVLLTGDQSPLTYSPSHSLQFHDIKGVFTQLCQLLGLSLQCYPDTTPWLHPVECLTVTHKSQPIGYIATLHPKLTKAYHISQPVMYLQLSLSAILNDCFPNIKHKPFSKHPAIRRDMALTIPKSMSYEEITQVITKHQPKLLSHFYLFDLFESEKIGPNHKSMAFAFIYQDLNKTLSDDKVNRTHDRLTAMIQETLGITTRSE